MDQELIQSIGNVELKISGTVVESIYCPYCKSLLVESDGEFYCSICEITVKRNPWRILKRIYS